MTTARDIMHRGEVFIDAHQTVTVAAKRMRDLGVGALPIRGDDNRLQGMITDRDIVVQAIADGLDPNITSVGELAGGRIHHVEPDASIEEVRTVMERHQVRRLPVIEDHRMVGMVSEADIAGLLPADSRIRSRSVTRCSTW